MSTRYYDQKSINLTLEFSKYNSKTEEYEKVAYASMQLELSNREEQRSVRYSLSETNDWFSIEATDSDTVKAIKEFFDSNVHLVESKYPGAEMTVSICLNEHEHRFYILNDPYPV